jgi:hypothetical protein
MQQASYSIFIISFNRLTVLQRSLDSYLKLDGIEPRNITVIDTGSTNFELLRYYEHLRQMGVSISMIGRLNGGADDLNCVADVIESAKQSHAFDYYAVTDPDVSLEDSRPDALDIYRSLLDADNRLQIVGPMLRIEDIPADYPARDACFKRHRDQFWHKRPACVEINEKRIYYQIAPIDTTFGLLRRRQKFRRLLMGARLYRPYDALHLDWYFTPSNIPEDQLNYIKTTNLRISHWGPWFMHSPNERLADDEKTIFTVREIEGKGFAPISIILP